jgi:uncharacterized protein (TIGR00369 family)
MTESSADEHFAKLQRMYLSAEANRLDAPAMRIARGSCEISMAIRSVHFHSAGTVHGSVFFRLLDDSAYFAAASLERNFFMLTAEFSVHFVRPANRERLRAVGKILYRTHRITVAESKVFDYKDRLVATGSGSFISGQKPLDGRLGYA